jgi:iron complex outermembrane receptor protein
MLRIAILIITCFLSQYMFAQEQEPVKDSFYTLSPVEVKAVRAGENAPFTKSNLSGKDIRKMNLGQDLPFLLNQTPSVVVNSDAGNGIGYTGIRIRGTDATRINVTLNGVPYNDAESQGTFFVDLPDFASSAGSIQIQRGTGTSSNGSGAFGGSINISTNELKKERYWEFNNSFGSFNSWKNTIMMGTGLLADHFTADLRLSRISSNGFIDRASSHLKSLHASMAYTCKTTSLRFNVFSGKEKTYQSWYGISEDDLRAGRRTMNYAGTEKSGDPYENETDNYWQDHYQFFFSQKLNKKLGFNTAFFYTRGKGYYEQYKADALYSDYGVTGPDISSDIIRRLWLDNDFYGNIFSLQYTSAQTQAVFGGAYSVYKGDHFGKLVWAAKGFNGSDTWYFLNARKNDFNIYIKQQTAFAKNWHYYYDLQYRHVNYALNGFRDNPSLHIKSDYDFFNPKAGISYSRKNWKGYVSYGIANKEPNRDDFETGMTQQPKPEHLQDIEAGLERSAGLYKWSATFYYMRYKDQLVLTGRINDVGAYTRTNIPESYRTGIELQGSATIHPKINISGNLTLSSDKVKDFSEYIDDYDNGGQKLNQYTRTDIAFSPALVGGVTINILPVKNFEITFLSKYVSRQFLDNTEDKYRSLDPFYVQDMRLMYTIKKKWLKEMNIIGQVNNLLNGKYEPNGYTYNYIYGGELSVNNYYFPMAGINLMIGVNIRL